MEYLVIVVMLVGFILGYVVPNLLVFSFSSGRLTIGYINRVLLGLVGGFLAYVYAYGLVPFSSL